LFKNIPDKPAENPIGEKLLFSGCVCMLLLLLLSRLGCDYGDHASWCPDYIRGAQDCEDPSLAEQCCGTCSNYKRKKKTSNHLGDLPDFIRLAAT